MRTLGTMSSRSQDQKCQTRVFYSKFSTCCIECCRVWIKGASLLEVTPQRNTRITPTLHSQNHQRSILQFIVHQYLQEIYIWDYGKSYFSQVSSNVYMQEINQRNQPRNYRRVNFPSFLNKSSYQDIRCYQEIREIVP